MSKLEVSNALRLTHFEIQGLFGEYNYLIPLNADEHVTAIIAPNGTGKTLCLRLISAFFKKKWGTMLGIEFDVLKYSFSNGKLVTIEKTEPIETDENDEEAVSLRVTIQDENGENAVEWAPKMRGARRKVSIERYLPFMTRAGSSSWRHDHTGQMYDFPDLVEEFGEQLPESIKSGLWGEIPSSILELTDKIECRLIETQRLLVLNDDRDQRYYGHRPERASTLAIMKKAQALKDIISREINDYAAYSQSLDRTFPHRVALLRNSRLRHDCPFPLWHQATRTISAVPRAEKRFIRATRIWISAVWRSGSLAAMRSPKALRHRIFASIRLRTW